MRRALMLLFLLSSVLTVHAQAPDLCQTDEHGCARFAPGESIKLAIAAPLTGDSANIGLSYSQAMQLAIALANEEPLFGFSFAQVDENDRGTSEGGAASAERLAADPGVAAIVGHAFSGASRAAIPIYEAAGIPMVSASATNPTLTQMDSSVFNRVVFNDNAQGTLAARYLYLVLNIRRLVVVSDDSIYSIGLAAVARDEFIALGGEVVLEVAVEPDRDEYLDTLTEIAAADPDAIFFPGYTPEVAAMAQSLDEVRLDQIVFMGADGVNTSTLIDLIGEEAEGIYLTGEAQPAETDAKIAFDALYRQTFGMESTAISRTIWVAFDAAQVVIAAVRSVAVLGDDGALYIPRGALIAAVRGTQNYNGVSGLIHCDEVGECNTVGPDISLIQNGDSVRVPLNLPEMQAGGNG